MVVVVVVMKFCLSRVFVEGTLPAARSCLAVSGGVETSCQTR